VVETGKIADSGTKNDDGIEVSVIFVNRLGMQVNGYGLRIFHEKHELEEINHLFSLLTCGRRK
jgi:hypothetical protein